MIEWKNRRGRLMAGCGAFTLVAGVVSAPAEERPAFEATLADVRHYHNEHRISIIEELRSLLALPNVASDHANIEKNALHLKTMLEERGMTARLLRVDDAPPAVLGDLSVPGATRTLMFYAHYDGQPAQPETWSGDPWTPVLRDGLLEEGARERPWSSLATEASDEWRIYARSASDDKSPIVAMLTALDALRSVGTPLTSNLKFFFEGEEEAGSPHLEALLRQHASVLTADVWIFCDGPVHQSRRPQIVFGVRGVLDLEMTVYGPLHALHSGHYGNWAPNPIALLTECIASMRDADGNILIPGFLDVVRPLSSLEQQAIEAVPAVEEQLLEELALATSEGGGAPLLERILRPAMNLRGIESGGVEERAKNAVPTEAKASIDFRLVPDQTPAAVRALVEAHLHNRGFTIVSNTPDRQTRRQHAKLVKLTWGTGYPPYRTSMELPLSRAVIETVEATFGGNVVKIPSLGGSLPLYLFKEILDTPLIVVPMVNHDNNQHAANENLRLGNLWLGIELYANLMAHLGEIW